jgi:hypothetical protein
LLQLDKTSSFPFQNAPLLNIIPHLTFRPTTAVSSSEGFGYRQTGDV